MGDQPRERPKRSECVSVSNHRKPQEEERMKGGQSLNQGIFKSNGFALKVVTEVKLRRSKNLFYKFVWSFKSTDFPI